MRAALSFVAITLALFTGIASAAPPKKIVLIAGKKSHGPEGNGIHDYPWSVRLLKVMLANSNVREQIRVETHFDGWPKDPRTLDNADTIMVISDGRDGDKFEEASHFSSPEHIEAISKQIQRGCGFAVFHFSTFAPDAYAPQILEWSGGYFDWETDGKREWFSAIKTAEAEVQLAAPDHPISRGVKPFKLREEFYHNLRFTPGDKTLTYLLNVPALQGRKPDGNVVAWAKQRANGGRGFGTTCGHFYDNWRNPDFRRFVVNALVWTAGVEIPEGGVETRFYDHDEIMAELDRMDGRVALPESYEEPATPVAELTPAIGSPSDEAFRSWHRSHGGATSSRFSALKQIDRSNVANLAVAWTYRSGDGNGNIQCNPIVVGNTMFAPVPSGHIVAVNASTGQERWRFKPDAPASVRGQSDPPARRGLVFWPGDEQASARLIFTAGRWIYALNPETGEAIREFGENGHVAIEAGGTVAGAVFKNVLVIPGFEKDVYGYDAVSGKQLWTFHTIPQPGEYGYETWDKPDKGANCWGGMALDEQRGIAFISTGSPKPDFSGMLHRGQNLFANCLIALDAMTGQRLWHFQEVRHDIWDWDIPAPPILTTIVREGKRVDVVAQVTKLGNTLVLDRTSGKSVFPVRMQRAAESQLPGEQTWPYQPDIRIPEPFTRQQFRAEEVTNRTPEARDAVMRVVGRANYGWFAPFAEAKPTVIFNEHGGAEWTGACVDQRNGRLFVSSNEVPWYITLFRNDEPVRDPNLPPTAGQQLYQQTCAACHGADRRGGNQAPPLVGLRLRMKDADVLSILQNGRGAMPPWPQFTEQQRKELLDFLFLRDLPDTAAKAEGPTRWTFGGWQKLLDHEGYPGCTPPWGTLNCIDLNTGKIAWRVPLGEYEELTRAGIPKTGTENFGGAAVTAGGLVFCAGTRDSKIRAFDAESGNELWSHPLPFVGSAPPTIYEVDGRQFIVVPATGGGKLATPTGDAYVAFALPK
ncbi:outer membrane protein assembly factor BamB family protein [Verrucomicrobiota bacterium sgz303538]